MGTTLTGTTPQDTYDSLIKVTDNGPLSGTAKYLSDGLGNDSKLALSTGNIGIGTSSPSTTLHLDASGGATIRLQRTSASANRFDVGTDGTNMEFNVRDTGAFTFGGGNVGIGTSSPATKLEVNEAAAVAQATLSGIASTEGAILNLKNRAAKQFSANRNIVQIDNYLYTEASPTTGGMTRIKSGHTGSGVNSSFISFSTSPNDGNLTERVRVTNDGLTFNGDTAAANALDDYEEGDWTPAITFDGGSTGITYQSRGGKYTKVGRQVSVSAYILLSSKGSSTGNAAIEGLPFTIANAVGFYSSAPLSALSQLTFSGIPSGYGAVNTTKIELVDTQTTGTQIVIYNTNFTNGTQILLQFTYFV